MGFFGHFSRYFSHFRHLINEILSFFVIVWLFSSLSGHTLFWKEYNSRFISYLPLCNERNQSLTVVAKRCWYLSKTLCNNIFALSFEKSFRITHCAGLQSSVTLIRLQERKWIYRKGGKLPHFLLQTSVI